MWIFITKHFAGRRLAVRSFWNKITQTNVGLLLPDKLRVKLRWGTRDCDTIAANGAPDLTAISDPYFIDQPPALLTFNGGGLTGWDQYCAFYDMYVTTAVKVRVQCFSNFNSAGACRFGMWVVPRFGIFPATLLIEDPSAEMYCKEVFLSPLDGGFSRRTMVMYIGADKYSGYRSYSRNWSEVTDFGSFPHSMNLYFYLYTLASATAQVDYNIRCTLYIHFGKRLNISTS